MGWLSFGEILGNLMGGGTLELPLDIASFVEKVKPFAEEISVHKVTEHLITEADHPEGYEPGARVALLHRSFRTDEEKIARREQAASGFANSLRACGWQVGTSHRRANVNEARLSVEDGTYWRVRKETLTSNSPNVSVRVNCLRAPSTAKLPHDFAPSRYMTSGPDDPDLEPISLEARIRFGKGNKYVLCAKAGSTFRAVAAYCTKRALQRQATRHVARPKDLAGHLRDIPDWAFVGSTADVLRTGQGNGLDRLHIAVPEHRLSDVYAALDDISVPGEEPKLDTATGEMRFKTKYGTVAVNSLASEVFKTLPVERVGMSTPFLPLGPGTGAPEHTEHNSHALSGNPNRYPRRRSREDYELGA